MRNPPGGKAAARSILHKAPEPDPGAFFSRPGQLISSRHLLPMRSRMNAAEVMAFSTATILARFGLWESSSSSFRTQSKVAANRIA